LANYLNAGVWPSKPTLSSQGFEIAFAVNSLGHYLLLELLIKNNAFISNPNAIFITGDIYVLADDCTPNFNGSGTLAYSRSKLCVNWLYAEFKRRNRLFNSYLVHPGTFIYWFLHKFCFQVCHFFMIVLFDRRSEY
jgi:hypothetical protein